MDETSALCLFATSPDLRVPAYFFCQPPADGNLIYVVEDIGFGFDMTQYRKLFVTFQELHSNEDFPGTGIGLAFVKRIVERYNGRTWADRKVAKCATFFFCLDAF